MSDTIESAELMRRLLDTLFAFVGVVELDGTLIEANRAPLEAAGIPASDVIGKKFWDCFWWNYSSEVQFQLIDACERAKGGEIVRYDVPVRIAGGGLMWIDFQLAPLRDGQGRITHLIPSAIDLTRRQRAEKERCESEARFRATFENAAVGIAHVAPNGAWLSVNRRLCEILGYPQDELLALNFQKITHPEDLEADLAQLDRMIEGATDRYHREKRYLRKDGSIVWVKLTVGSVRTADGAIDYFIAVIEDISERKLGEGALRESEGRLRLALDAAQLGAWRWEVAKGAEGLEWDSRCEELFGLYPGAPMTNETWMNAVPPEDRTAADLAVACALDPDNPCDHYACEYRVRHADGTTLWIAATGRAFFEPDPTASSGRRVVSMAGILRDVTGVRLAETARRAEDRRNRYLLGLEKRLQVAATANEAIRFACEALGLELQASVVCLRELKPFGEDKVLESGWSARTDTTPLLGGQRLADRGVKRVPYLLAGQAVIVRDVVADPLTAGDETALAAYGALGLRSSIDVPLMRNGEACALLLVGDAQPRAWTASQVALACETLDRVWQAIERGRADALRESEARLRHLGDSLPESAVYRYSYDADGTPRFSYMSAGIEQLNGVRAEQVLMDASILLRQTDPDYLPRLLEAERRSARELSDFKMEIPMRRPDGEERWMLLQSRPRRMQDGCVVWDGIQTDITDRKRAETALLESEERFRGVFENAPTGIAMVDLHGRFESCNPAFSAMLGFAEHELRGRHFSELVHPADRGLNMVEHHKLLARKIPAFEISNRFIGKNGKSIWVHKHVSLLRSAGGTPTGIVALVTNMTERRRAEAARARAEEADRAKSRLLSNVSHELRTPMNGIIGFNELLLKTDLTTQQAEYAELVQSSSISLLALIDDLLDLEKIERGAMTIEVRPFALYELLSAARTLEVLAAKKSLEFSIECFLPEDTMLLGDLTRIRQIVTNLLGNAIKFTEEGGVRLSISREDGMLRLAIADTGCGISADDKAAIFDLFYRGGASRAGKVQGSGLGLSIAKELAELMGGEIAVTTEARSGTTFTVALPLADAPRETRAAENQPPSSPVGLGARSFDVLVVEDNPVNLKLVLSILCAAGCRAKSAENGKDALDRLEQEDFDLIILDNRMPVMSGIDAMKTIRARPDWKRRIPILLLTADAMKGADEKYVSAGADLYMSKPLRVEHFIASVKQMAQQGRELRLQNAASDVGVPV
jgi:PAS domain S-box-containing protein